MSRHVDAQIRAAIERGDFDDMPLKGKPLDLSEEAGIAPEMRPAVRILKNAGVLPEELQLRAETLELRDLLKVVTEPEERREIQNQLNKTMLRYELLTSGKSVPAHYQAQLRDRVTGTSER